ncbi:Antilisterial bacteriocin subtilosin biosynthesis protein AlbA [Poriferisphaera corsica]|uniref:Antilisterial bacteriocin subtilosin biosynthesis protein AlbA n=2 Tax=Poriferisphaera corsica TaxID=2528020 RepID=A0A517YR64_9BACT|nr:Antilisterial bacteriocin subtilosin biosynthesis protein AlbA [Poriferisphaera corsica]
MRSAWTYQIEDTKHSPLLVFYEATRACDLVCKHCRACAQPQSHPNELSTDDSKALIDQLATFPKKPILVITGGDPLKRPDIFELIAYATESAGLDVSFVPSATPLLNVASLKKLQKAGISRLGLSIDGKDAATHDEQRGIPGTFTHAVDMLKVAKKLGLETQVNTTITKANVDQISDMADILEPLNIDLWSVFYLVPVGRGINDLKIDPPQYKDSFAALFRESQRRPFPIKTTEAPFYRRYLLQQQEILAAMPVKGKGSAEDVARPHRESNGNTSPIPTQNGNPRSTSKAPLGLNDGKGIMFVSHIGDVYPSGFLPVDCGNSRQQSVVDIYQNSDTFKKLRRPEILKGKCGYCNYRCVCGGSRARAKALTGDMLAPEPDCGYIPPTFAQHINRQKNLGKYTLDNHITTSNTTNIDLLNNEHACTCQQAAASDI